MRLSSAIAVCAFGFMAGTAVFSLLGFSWWIISTLVLCLAVAGVLEATDNTRKTILAFFVFLSVLAGFARASSYNFSSGDREKTFWASTREYLVEKSGNVLPKAEGAVFNAMVFGDEKDISQDLKNAFNVTGTRHILAISGMNITIISQMLLYFGLLLGMWRKHAFWFAVAGVVSFIFLVGSPPSAVRAGIMGIILLWSQNRGRLVESWRPIAVAAFIMVAVNPRLLIFDVGFQLSFLAVLGIVYFQGFFGRIFKWIPVKFIRDVVVLSFAVQIVTWPVTVYNFGTFSTISPAANIFIVPMLTPIMFLGLGFAVFSWWAAAAKLFLWPVWLILKSALWIIFFFASVPWATINTGKAGIFLLAAYYPILFWFWKFLDRRGLTESNP